MEHRGIYNRTEIDKSLERNRNKKASLSEEKQRRLFVVNGNVSRETLKYGCVKLVKEHLHGCADFLVLAMVLDSIAGLHLVYSLIVRSISGSASPPRM